MAKLEKFEIEIDIAAALREISAELAKSTEYMVFRAAQEFLATMQADRRAADLRERAARNNNRPSIILKASLDGTIDEFGEPRYLASYGSLFASGDTPDEAFANFDAIWQRGVNV